jgi:hypothetical protein
MTEVVRPVGVLRTRVEVRTYPREDEAFQHLVLDQLRRFDRVRHAAAIPARLEVLLQAQYPRARSRYQDPLASSSGMPLLYVFRDGSLINEDEAPEPEVPEVASASMTGAPTFAMRGASSTD